MTMSSSVPLSHVPAPLPLLPAPSKKRTRKTRTTKTSHGRRRLPNRLRHSCHHHRHPPSCHPPTTRPGPEPHLPRPRRRLHHRCWGGRRHHHRRRHPCRCWRWCAIIPRPEPRDSTRSHGGHPMTWTPTATRPFATSYRAPLPVPMPVAVTIWMMTLTTVTTLTLERRPRWRTSPMSPMAWTTIPTTTLTRPGGCGLRFRPSRCRLQRSPWNGSPTIEAAGPTTTASPTGGWWRSYKSPAATPPSRAST